MIFGQSENQQTDMTAPPTSTTESQPHEGDLSFCANLNSITNWCKILINEISYNSISFIYIKEHSNFYLQNRVIFVIIHQCLQQIYNFDLRIMNMSFN